MKSDIDFVITWVDGDDPEWIKLKKQYSRKENDGKDFDERDSRYRDWDCLKYLFRGIEKYAPWVRKVFFITCGHKPSWLNEDCKKLVCVSHDEFMPADSLPTFNSNAIQVNLHNIKELSEKFVLFDDDMYITDHVKPDDFFYGKLPCDSAVMVPIIANNRDGFSKTLQNNIAIINSYFKKNEVLKKNWKKWFNIKYKTANIKTLCMMPWNFFTGFWTGHIPNSLKKSTIKKIWGLESDVLNDTTYSRFRNNNTNVNHWLFSNWNIAKGDFYPRDIDFGHYFEYGKDSKELYDAIKRCRYKTICLNDVNNSYDFEKEKRKTILSFEHILPQKSEFEI